MTTQSSVYPECEICRENNQCCIRAKFLGAQSLNAGKYVTWIKVCDYHALDWNKGGDWEAPLLPIGDCNQ